MPDRQHRPYAERPRPCLPMMTLPKPKKTHEIGCDLTFLSAGDLEERITLLKEEISRLEADKAAKTSSRRPPRAFFKSK
jgi:uncharacterized small protein (DUF1192 family)